MVRFVAVLSLLIGISAPAWAQATAQIPGTVKDASGLAVPGATVTAKQTETGFTRAATSGADGGYVLTNLALGPYSLEISKEGFSRYVQTGLTLSVNDSPTIDIALKVGSVSEQVQVEANAGLVETQSTNVGQIIEAYEAKKGEYPGSLQELTEGKTAKLKAENIKDPWKIGRAHV